MGTTPPPVLKKAEDWLQTPEFLGYVVRDPDGWRHPDMSWDDLITKEEMWKRLSESTIKYPH